jgi:hypothetical protein
MGWFGYGIYDGDDTQSLHYTWLVKIGVCRDLDDAIDSGIVGCTTKIPKNKIYLLIKNWRKIASSLSKKIETGEWDKHGHDEGRALEWQMLLALFNDNNLKAPKLVFKMGIEGTKFLMGEHSSDFDRPSSRRATLKRFIEKSYKLQGIRLIK